MESADNGIATMRTIIARIRTIDWVGALTLGDQPLRELVDGIAIIEVIDPTGDTRLVAHGVAGEELLSGPLVEGLFGASDHAHEREVPAENGGIVFHGYVLPIVPDVELPTDADLVPDGADRSYWERAGDASSVFALARLLAWVSRADSLWHVAADHLGADAEPDGARAAVIQDELDWWFESSAGYVFGGQAPGWMVLTPNAVRMWMDVAVASASGAPVDASTTLRTARIARLLAHELCHVVTPKSIDDIWDAELVAMKPLDWIEEGGAYLMPMWRGHVARLAEAMGLAGIDDADVPRWSDPRFDAMRALVALLDLDIDRPQDEDAAFDLLLRPRLTDVPGVLARALDQHLGLGLDPSGIALLAQRVLEVDGDVGRVADLARDLGVPVDA